MEKKNKLPVRSLPPLPSLAPWLYLPYNEGRNQVFYNLLQPNKKKRNYTKRIQEIGRRSYWQSPSHENWLVILCNDKFEFTYTTNSIREYGDCFLWNPLSLEEIKLPNLLNWFESDKYFISSCVLTSPPSNNKSMIFFLFEWFATDLLLVYCRPGDHKWRSEKLFSLEDISCDLYGGSLICFGDKLYIFFNNHWQLEIEIDNKVEDDTPMRPFSISPYPTLFLDRVELSFQQRFVVCFDELLMVHKYYISRGSTSLKRFIFAIQICRFDFSSMVWEELTSLGNHVIFLGENTTACCSATELGLTRGCMFYTFDGDQNLYKYDLEGKSITVSLPFLNLPMPCLNFEWLMIRPIVRVCDEGRMKGNNNEKEDNTIDAHQKKISITNEEKEVVGQELEEANSCGNLDKDILALIASYLPPVDYVHLRAVSRWNRSVLPASNWRTSFAMIHSPILSLSPLLVFSEGNGSRYNFIDPMHNNENYFTSNHEILLGATIHFSKDGWLLMTKGEMGIFFYNPFTRESIQLPDLPVVHCNNQFYGISFSSSPNSSDCRIFAITVMDDEDLQEVFISFITRGQDIWWSGVYSRSNIFQPCLYPKSNIFWSCLNNSVFCNGAFYSLDDKGSLGVFKTNTRLFEEILAGPKCLFNPAYPKLLVEYERNLFLVDFGDFGLSIRIFKLDFSSMEWVRVESLGKHMMFIGNTSCTLAVASNSNMENKIYLPRLHGDSIIYYSLENDRCYSVGSQTSIDGFYDTTELLSCSWIHPNRNTSGKTLTGFMCR